MPTNLSASPAKRLRPMVLALIGAFAAPTFATETQLADVVVSASRRDSNAADAALTITPRSAADIETQQPVDATALVADEPDVAVSRDRRRFGATNFNIRGIEDNRVLMLVDGVRLPDYYSRGGPSNISTATRDMPEQDFLKRVEIVRGPASSLYGSDAIGGVVSFVTKDASDFITQGKTVGGELVLHAASADQSWGTTGSVAAKGETVEALLMVSRREGHELGNQGDVDTVSVSRTAPNPQDNTATATLAKLGWTPSAEHRFTLAHETRKSESETELKRLSSSLPRVTAASGTEDNERQRATFGYTWTPASGVLDRLVTSASWQKSDIATDTLQRRSNTSATCSATLAGKNNCDVQLGFEFAQEQWAASIQGERTLSWGSSTHLLIGGLDWLDTHSEELRTATRSNLTTGSVSNALAGETFPLRDFPPGSTQQLGLFLQDEIRLANDRVIITPGLRWDRYELSPEADPLYDTHTAKPAVSKSDSAFSPRLSAVWRPTDPLTLYAQWVTGFRAPSYEEVNGSFMNLAQGYGSSPNPDLEAESSQGIEIGTRWTTQSLALSWAAYHNRYENFIEQVVLNCPADPACIAGLKTTYQYRNQSKVTIYGTELRGAWQFAPQWKLDGATAWAHGTNNTTDQPLNTVEPLRATLGLSWQRDAQATLGSSLRMRAAAGVSRVDESSGELYKPGGWTTFDVYAWWKPLANTRLNLALTNLADRKYWLWSDVRQVGLAASDPGLDFYTATGRAVSASVAVSF
jgi:hemoglobin/transferrin/lactoferrin receptor protein